jgi:hypothetical protein
VVTVANPGAASSKITFLDNHFESSSGSLSAAPGFLVILGQNVLIRGNTFLNDRFAPPAAFIDINATASPPALVVAEANQFFNSSSTSIATFTFLGSTQPTLYLCCTLNSGGAVTGVSNTTRPAGRLAIYADVTNGASQLSSLNGGFFAPSLGPTQSGRIWDSGTAPAVSAAFSSGTVGGSNGTGSFFVAIGSGSAGSTRTITLPAATTGWNCCATNQTRAAQIQQTDNKATSVTLTNFGTTFSRTNWTNGDTLIVTCRAR